MESEKIIQLDSYRILEDMIELESLYDRHDYFKWEAIKESSSATTPYHLNPGGVAQDISIGSGCTRYEKEGLVQRFNKYRDVFTWIYVDLKGF